MGTTGTLTARDGTLLATRRWTAAASPWARVVIVHGIAEHSGRYAAVGEQLAAAGLDVLAYDQRGFGQSSGRRAYVDRWTRQHDDLEAVLSAVRHEAPDRPVALFGHSLGGLVALGYVLGTPARPVLPDRLVLSAPAVESTVPAWKRAMAAVLGKVTPTFALTNDLDGSLLSRDPAVGQAYAADPLNVHVTTTRFGAEAIAEQGRVLAALGRLSIPTLVYHGEADGLVPTASSRRLASLPGVTRRTWPDLRHETHNEPEGPAVIAEAIAWLRQSLADPTPRV